MWSRCAKEASSLHVVVVPPLSNGILTAKLNGVLGHTWVAQYNPADEIQRTMWKPQVARGDNHVELIFQAQDSSKDATASIILSLKDVQLWVDACMARKLCLEELGDGSAESFALRNDNKQQLQCLQAGMHPNLEFKWIGILWDDHHRSHNSQGNLANILCQVKDCRQTFRCR